MARLFGWIQRNNNPWGSGGDNQGPPELDALFKKFFKSGKKGRNGAGGGGESTFPLLWSFLFVAVVIIIIWALSGIYLVQPAEKGVVLRFGKYQTTVGPGPHWFPRFIDQKYVMNIDQIRTLPLDQLMLTEGENIVSVAFIVQYQVNSLKDYLFNTVSPTDSLQQVLDTAVRQVIGQSQLDEVLTIGREEVRARIEKLVEKLVNKYKLGINVVAVTMQSAKAPEAVKAAFDDVIKAREDNARYSNEATSYANNIVPIAQGQAARLAAEAKAYQQQVILTSKGKVAKFKALEPIYQSAPEVTKQRMFYGTVSDALTNSQLYLVDGGPGSHNLFYLPLDKSAQSLSAKPLASNSHTASTMSNPPPTKVATAASSVVMQNAYNRWQEAQQ